MNRYFFSLLYLLLILFSCEDGKKNLNETPKALEDSKLNIASFRGYSSNLVEELYKELTDKSDSLKKLENDLETFQSNSSRQLRGFDSYHSKSRNYYEDARNMATAISDSLLMNEILFFIHESNNAYSRKTAELNTLRELIFKNTIKIKDLRSILKISLTLPLIEKYQDINLPGKKELQDLIEEQEKLIRETIKLTPEH